MATGGPVESVEVRGRTFSVAADSDANLMLGGFQNEIQSNGDGTHRTIKTRVPWSVDSIALSIDPDRADLEFLQEVADSKEDIVFNLTLVSNVTYQATGQITGEIKMSTQNTTAPISMMGGGKAEQQ